jgi:hypothetical protein
MESAVQSLKTEISELHKIIKQQSEKITYNETIMAHLVTCFHSGNGSTHPATDSSDDEDEDDDDDDDKEEEEDSDEDKLCINSSYEKRLDYLEQFVFNLEKKILELEKRQPNL